MKVMLEVLPPQRRANNDAVAAAVERIRDAASKVKSVSCLNVPEITEENYAGVPLYKHLDACEFGSALYKATKLDVVVNKVIAYLGSETEFRSWVENSVSSYGIRSFVFVGGNSHTRNYPGPSIVRANEIASGVNGVRFGNICIPSRHQEVDRLVMKTQAGASFFTTQLVFEPGHTTGLLKDYQSRCAEKGLKPAAFYISLAPVVTKYDIDFFKWLGAEMPERTEAMLRKGNDPLSSSISLMSENFAKILGFARDKRLGIDVFPNVEAISSANIDSACGAVNAILDRVK